MVVSQSRRLAIRMTVAISVLIVGLIGAGLNPTFGATGTGASNVGARAAAIDLNARAATQYFYMVRNVRKVGNIYIGDFAIVQRNGKLFRGAWGTFPSGEYECFRGKFKCGKVKGTSYNYVDNTNVPFKKRWKGSGANQRFATYHNVTAQRLKQLSGGFVTKASVAHCL